MLEPAAVTLFPKLYVLVPDIPPTAYTEPSDDTAISSKDELLTPVTVLLAHSALKGIDMLNDIVAVVEPPELLAVMINVVADCSALGVPDMTPVVVFSVSPSGSIGSTDHEVAVPVMVGVLLAITVPRA